MTEPSSCLSFADLAEYWTADASPEEIDRIERHVFDCARCATSLAEAEWVRSAIQVQTRRGEVLVFVTDAVVNRLAREGVRMRSYSLEPGQAIQCAVWADDEMMVARFRGDFSGLEGVDAEMRLESGEEWVRAFDVPVRPGVKELVLALPASGVRQAPEVPIHLTLRRPSADGSGAVLAEYVFEHEGAHQRADQDS